MNVKRVCILRSNPVNPDSRVEKEAISLTKAGYDVHILAWDRSSNHKPSYEQLYIGGVSIPIVRLGYQASFGEGMKNIVPYLKFQFAMRKHLRHNRYDLVHACDFDTAFFTHRLVKQKKEKFIFDIFDILGDDERTFREKVLKWVQMKIVNASDGTIICTEERKKQIEKSHPKRLAVIHNTPSSDQLNITNEVFLSNEKPRVCYVGILQNGRLLQEIGTYFENHPEIEFHIGGFGYLEPYFKDLSQKCDNVFYYGKTTYDKTLALEQSSDIMLAIYDPSISNHRFAAPNKFYESIFLGKPIIMVKGTGMSSVVADNDIGVLIDYSETGFASGMQQLLSRRDEWSAIGEKMKNIYRTSYNWDEMEHRLISLYQNIFHGE